MPYHPPCRFVYELNRKQSHVREHTQQLKEGMECVNGAKERACLIEERLGREERVLEEKEEAYSKLLVQLGQDMAISQEHGRLVARQRERIGHLRKVREGGREGGRERGRERGREGGREGGREKGREEGRGGREGGREGRMKEGERNGEQNKGKKKGKEESGNEHSTEMTLLLSLLAR